MLCYVMLCYVMLCYVMYVMYVCMHVCMCMYACMYVGMYGCMYISYIQFAYQPENSQGGKLETARFDLIDRCRKRELGARFRIETRNESRLGATSRQLGRNFTPTWPPKPGQVGSPRAPIFAFQHWGGKFLNFVLKINVFGTDSACLHVIFFTSSLCFLDIR